MTTLQATLVNVINDYIMIFNKQIGSKYDINEEELNILWNQIINEKVEEKKVVEKKVEEKKVVEKKVEEKVEEKVTPSKETRYCPYIFAKGVNIGQQCTCKPKKGAVYCSKHKKYEGTEPKSVKKSPLPAAKKTIVPVSKKLTPPVKKPNVILVKNKKIDKFVHQESSLVFKSEKEKNVIGRLCDDKIVDLSDEDIDNCKKYGFKYELKKVEDEEPDPAGPPIFFKKKLIEFVSLCDIDIDIDSFMAQFDTAEDMFEELEEKYGELYKKKTAKEDLEEEEEDLEEEEEEDLEEDEEDLVKKISRKITDVPQELKATEASSMKKSIQKAISTTNAQAEDVDEILKRLNIQGDDDSDDECSEQECEDELEEEY